MIRVAVCIFTDGKKFLLQHRDANAPITPNTWGFFGGHLEGDETPEEGLRREIREELQEEVSLDFFGEQKFMHEYGQVAHYVFIAPLPAPLEQLRKQQREGDGIGLFTIEELHELKDFPPRRLQLVEEVVKHLSKLKDRLNRSQ